MGRRSGTDVYRGLRLVGMTLSGRLVLWGVGFLGEGRGGCVGDG